jgi:hypothetical protein
MSLTAAQREALGRVAFEAMYPRLDWHSNNERDRERWCVTAESVIQTWSAEMAPTEPPTKPDRRLTPSPFAAVRPALEAGRDAAGLSRQRGEDEP